MSGGYWKPGSKDPSVSLSKQIVMTNSIPQPVEDETEKKKLSKSVMGMKFMKHRTDISNVNPDASILKASLDWSNENKDNDISINSGNYELKSCIKEDFNFNSVLPGRRSFNGCNNAIERLYKNQLDDLKYYKNNKVKDVVIVEEDKSNMTEDMIKMYEGLVGLPRGPNQGQRVIVDNNNRKSNTNKSKDSFDKKRRRGK